MSESWRIRGVFHNGRSIDMPWNDDRADDEALQTIISTFAEGNYSCDCNRRLIAEQYGNGPPVDWDNNPCGESDQWRFTSLVAVSPGGTEHRLGAEDSCQKEEAKS